MQSIITESDAKRILNPFLKRIDKCLKQANSQFLATYKSSDRTKLSKTNKAWIYLVNIQMNLRNEFSNDHSVKIKDGKDNQFTFCIQNRLTIKVNKLNNRFRITSLNNQHAKRYVAQEENLFPELMILNPNNLILGYQIDEILGTITGYITKQNNSNVEWKINTSNNINTSISTKKDNVASKNDIIILKDRIIPKHNISKKAVNYGEHN